MLTWEDSQVPTRDAFTRYQIIRRSGNLVPFEPEKPAAAFTSEVAAVRRLTNAAVALDGLCSYSRQRLGMLNLKQKSRGFFSASKANLRNAP